MINSDAAEEDSALISTMESHPFDNDPKAQAVRLSSPPDTLRIPSPASTVYITTPINDNEESGGMFPIEHQDSFDLRNNCPIDEDLDTKTVFTSVTAASQYGMLSSTVCSPELTNAQEETFTTVTDQTSNTVSLSTAKSSTAVEPITHTETPLISDVKSGTSLGDSFVACQPNIAETYVSLTPWTSKFTSHGLGQIPLPPAESLPLPLVSSNNCVYLPHSSISNPVYCGLNSSNTTSNLVYSKIGPVSPRSNIRGGAHCTNHSAGAKSSSSPHVGLSSMHKPIIKIRSTPNKEHRFKKTADALQKSGLWEVAIKTGNLIKRNRELQRDLERFRADALLFLKSVIKNPQNRDYIKNLFNSALSANLAHQKKMTLMNVVAAAAAASVKLRTCSSTHDSGISSDGQQGGSGSQSDQSVTNFPCTKLKTASTGTMKQVPMETD